MNNENKSRLLTRAARTLLMVITFVVVLSARAISAATPAPATPTIYIQVYKSANRKIAEEIAPMISEQLFGLPVVVLEGEIRVPQTAWVAVREKYYGGRILDELSLLKPPNAIVIVGLLRKDIFTGRFPYVRGLSNPRIGACVVSTYRLQDASYYRFKMRVLKEALHEIGHLLGQDHCQYPDHCVMGFSKTLSLLDHKLRVFCPYHKAQIEKRLREKGILPSTHKLPDAASQTDAPPPEEK